ncbi:MAG: hypothetical protein K9H64_20865 [Bacteroidales bacterium]|nr:hypothetical protein [Bacteroidales bacterium]MCF8458478.1 hypothetical protein [Bacteroidales bacterium]
MLTKKTTLTIASKLVILFVNFILIVLQTQLWGSEGKGEIALVIANIALINIIANMSCGSTIAFHAPRMNREELLLMSFIGALALSLAGTLVFSFVLGFTYFKHLLVISVFMSLGNAITLYWLGKENIKWYNLLTLLAPVAILGFLFILYYLAGFHTVNAYFYAYYLGYGCIILIGLISLSFKQSFKWPVLSLAGFRKIMLYGFNNELNYFIQFLNYRLAYYFIEEWLGKSPLGVFSVAVSIAEAIWVVSKSMSVIHFSSVVNNPDQNDNIRRTKISARQSLWISLAVVVAMVLTPQSLFVYIFGSDFIEVKQYTIYLVPGIIAIAVSNLWGHYFAAVGKLNILRDKALVGLAATLVLSIILIPKYQLVGACITINVSYVLSSLYLWVLFLKEKSAAPR